MKTDLVTASEIGDFIYCQEGRRLAALGTKPTPAIQAARVEGTLHHGNLAAAESAASRSINGGRSRVVLGAVVLAILAVLWLVSR